jgi:transcription elongation factor Elf1
MCPLTVKRRYLSTHIRKHTALDRKYSCELCGAEFNNNSRLTFHTIQKHLQTSTFPCKLCGLNLPIKRGFQKTYLEHVKETHQELSKEEFDFLAYEISKLKAKNLCKDLPASILTAHSGKSTICGDCGMNLFTVKGLEKHRETVHGVGSLN